MYQIYVGSPRLLMFIYIYSSLGISGWMHQVNINM